MITKSLLTTLTGNYRILSKQDNLYRTVLHGNIACEGESFALPAMMDDPKEQTNTNYRFVVFCTPHHIFLKGSTVMVLTTLTVNVRVVHKLDNLYYNVSYDNNACEAWRQYFRKALENSNTVF